MSEQVNDTPRIVLATAWKTVADARLYGRLGRSLTGLGQVCMLGRAAKKAPSGVQSQAWPPFGRLSLRRLFLAVPLYRQLRRLQPALVVVNAPELLPGAVWYKWLHGAKVVYDCEENFALNALHNSHSPRLVRWLAAAWKRWLEVSRAPWVDHFVLAEKAYIQQLNFVRRSWSFLPNAYAGPMLRQYGPRQLPADRPLKVLVYGTLAPAYGTDQGLRWLLQLEKHLPHGLTLTLAGQVHSHDFSQELEQLCASFATSPTVHMHGLPLPPSEMLSWVAATDLVVLPYPADQPAFRGKWPSKLLEAMALNTPVVYTAYADWRQLAQPSAAGLAVPSFEESPTVAWTQQLLQSVYYTAPPPKGAFWKYYVPEWQATVQSLLAAVRR